MIGMDGRPRCIAVSARSDGLPCQKEKTLDARLQADAKIHRTPDEIMACSGQQGQGGTSRVSNRMPKIGLRAGGLVVVFLAAFIQ